MAKQEIPRGQVYLQVDQNQVEVWEVLVFEEEPVRLSKLLLVFAKYVAVDGALVSPDLPKDPVDELSPEEIQSIKSSDAYKLLKHFDMQQLMEAAKAFADKAGAKISPN